jgi:hypothetical protein
MEHLFKISSYSSFTGETYKIGAIKFFDISKGFGIICSVNNEEYFLKKVNFEGIEADLIPTTIVKFNPGFKRDNKLALAMNCSLISVEDVKCMFPLIEINSEIKIEKIKKYPSQNGKTRIYRDEIKIELLKKFLQTIVNSNTLVRFLNVLNHEIKLIIRNQNAPYIIELLKHLNSFFFGLNLSLEISESGNLEIHDIKFNLDDNTLIDYVLDNLKNSLKEEQKFELWKFNIISGFAENKMMFDFLIGSNKKVESYKSDLNSSINLKLNLPFDLKILESSFLTLTNKQIKRLENYIIPYQTIEKLSNLLTPIPINLENDLIRELVFTNFLKEEHQKSFRLNTYNKVSPEVFLNIWSKNEFKIDIEKKEILFSNNKSFEQNQFLIEKEILIKCASLINKQIVEKLIKFGDKGKKLLFESIISLKPECVGEKDIVLNIIHSIEVLDEEYKADSLKHLLNIININGWKLILENSWIKWEQDNLFVLRHQFKPSNPQKIKIVQAILECYNSDSIKNYIKDRFLTILSFLDKNEYDKILNDKLDFIDNNDIFYLVRYDNLNEIQLLSLVDRIDFLDEDESISILNLLKKKNIIGIEKIITDNSKLILNYSKNNLAIIFQSWQLNFLKQDFLQNIDVSDLKIIKSFLPSFEEDQVKFFIESNNFEKLSLKDYNEFISFIKNLGVYYLPICYTKLINENSPIEDVLDALKICNSLTEKDQRNFDVIFETLFNNKNFSINSHLRLYLEYSYTSRMQLNLVLRTNYLEFGVVLDFFQMPGYKPLLSKVDYFTVFKYGIEINTFYTLDYLIKNDKKLFKKITDDLLLSEKNYQNVFDFIDLNFNEIEVANSRNSEFNILISALKSENESKALKLYTQFNQSNNFSFQTILLISIIKLIHQNKIPIWHEKIQYEKCELKQLGAVLIKKFVEYNGQSDKNIIEALDLSLKEHFKLLEFSINNLTDFKNIFSINHLVKMCNGRKYFEGLNLWKGYNIERFYTEGNYKIVSNNSPEGIFCEGRFWKNTEIWSSETKRFTGKIQTSYWCKRNSCAEINTITDLNFNVSKWTLSEISSSKNISIDRLFYTNLAGWLNRMNTIFSKLKCNTCNNILRPSPFVPKILGFYAVPVFFCVNDKCTDFEMKIRFTHCRGCKSILDSRECKTCEVCNWLICNNVNCKKCGCNSNTNPIFVQH